MAPLVQTRVALLIIIPITYTFLKSNLQQRHDTLFTPDRQHGKGWGIIILSQVGGSIRST